MATAEQCAWAAGFVDGEGSICIRGPHGKAPHKSSYSISVSIANDDIRPMRFIAELWGGSLNPALTRPNGKTSTHWVVTAVKAATFLRDVLPYLQSKREQAELALEMQSTKRHIRLRQPLDDAVIAQWAVIKQKVSTLNTRYPGYYDEMATQGAK